MRTLRLLSLVVLLGGLVAMSAQQFRISQDIPASSVTVEAEKGGRHRLKVDDAPGFRTPLLDRSFTGTRTTFRWDDAGMVPGLLYFVQVDAGPVQSFRLQPDRYIALPKKDLSCRTLRHTWEVDGRFDVGTALSGLQWVSGEWKIKPHTFLPGEPLYNVEAVVRPAIAAARYCGQPETLDELAKYYSIMLTQTETVGHLLARPRVTQETRSRLSGVDADARTFSASFGSDVGEGELYNAQWLAPAALLLRVLTTLPPPARTGAMRAFQVQYAVFLVKDQLLRYLNQEHMPPLDGRTVNGRAARWEQAMAGARGADRWDSDVSDIDLWLLAAAVDVLGANANDPEAVPIAAADVATLQKDLAAGLRFIRNRRTLHNGTVNLQGKTVTSATYFDGEYDTHADTAFSAAGGEELPAPAMRKAVGGIAWDSSHMYRLALLFRALYENRKVLPANSFPSTEDIRQFVNQYVYKVFEGDFAQPLFRNYFDGNDGWFRVDYNGAGFGHPPSRACDMRQPLRPCLTTGELRGWGQLAFLNSDLEKLQVALIEMAFRSDAATKAFRDRYYLSSGHPFQRNVVDGFDTYGGLLYGVVAESADMISPEGD